MAIAEVSLPEIHNAIGEVYCALDNRSQGRPQWAEMTEDDLWRELVACILGSRVRFEAAHSAVERLGQMGLLRQSRRSSRFDQYERDLTGALSGESLAQDDATPYRRYPFFRTRANQIRRAAERLYGRRGSIRDVLDDECDPRGTRRRLASEVPGLGPKQASLFLRNIGYAAAIAILDVHVLTYMNVTGLASPAVKSVSTMRQYERLESALIGHAATLGYTPDHFDLAVWVVVKVAKEECGAWQ